MHERALLPHAVLGRRQIHLCIGSLAAGVYGRVRGQGPVVSRRQGPTLYQQRLGIRFSLSHIRRPSIYDPRNCTSIGAHLEGDGDGSGKRAERVPMVGVSLSTSVRAARPSYGAAARSAQVAKSAPSAIGMPGSGRGACGSRGFRCAGGEPHPTHADAYATRRTAVAVCTPAATAAALVAPHPAQRGGQCRQQRHARSSKGALQALARAARGWRPARRQQRWDCGGPGPREALSRGRLESGTIGRAGP
ncbi:hypothetical protein DFH09DRAFT_1421087 [Mycena vulgaris]|nr:hypothetical protein DFH09DRAFT_1421087 [Mycena vulgaris]